MLGTTSNASSSELRETTACPGSSGIPPFSAARDSPTGMHPRNRNRFKQYLSP